jgi:hypothetical protein
MLMGFSLENLIKAYLLQDRSMYDDAFSGDGKLSWGAKGHNLIHLFGRAGIEISDIEATYLDLWQTCALWAGRYPLPLKEHDLPRRRKSLSRAAALLKRAVKRITNARQRHDPLLGAEKHDLLHQNVGRLEWELFQALFERCRGCINSVP